MDTQNAGIGLGARRPVRSQLYPWYDSLWLARYTRAKAIIRKVRPEALPTFVNAFRVLHTRPDFEVRQFDRIFDDDILGEIRRVTATLRPADLELHEARRFGRFVVHNHPFFLELQERVIPLVSEAVSESVETGYNFLSLYGGRGVCAPHLDSPQSKWTLDLCLSQSAPWPIYLSQVRPWPESETEWPQADWEAQVKRSSSHRFTPYTLHPGQAIIFSGSSQWHYREEIPKTNSRPFCDLLFFHFIPQGAGELLRSQNWARLFGIPELSQDALTEESPASAP